MPTCSKYFGYLLGRLPGLMNMIAEFMGYECTTKAYFGNSFDGLFVDDQCDFPSSCARFCLLTIRRTPKDMINILHVYIYIYTHDI